MSFDFPNAAVSTIRMLDFACCVYLDVSGKAWSDSFCIWHNHKFVGQYSSLDRWNWTIQGSL